MNNADHSANQSEKQLAKLQKNYKGLAVGLAVLALFWIAIIAFMFFSKRGKPAVFIPIAVSTLLPLFLIVRNAANQVKKSKD